MTKSWLYFILKLNKDGGRNMAEPEIKLSFDLANIVWQELEKKGFKKRTNLAGFPTNSFTEDELAQITSLNLVNFNAPLTGLSHLKNLRSLSISTLGSTSYMSKNNLRSITDKDIWEIEKLTNLRHLSIDNQRLITSIDISNLTNLDSLQLTRNEELTEIIGLDKNRSIGALTLYDLNNLLPIKGFDQFIEHNDDLYDINLDVLLFPQAIGYRHTTKTFNQKAYERIIEDIGSFAKWSETCGNKTININNHQMCQLHQKASEIVSTYCKTSSDAEVVATIDRWLAENVKYNYGALDSTLRGESKDGLLQGPIRGANGAFNAFMYHSCVCEGYTRAMQYMLALKGIHSTNVSCIAGEDTLHMSEASYDNEFATFTLPKTGYHSICRVDRSGGCYYCDPCWDACCFQQGDKSLPYLLLTKEQISKDHTLSFDEQNISHQAPIPDFYLANIKSQANKRIAQDGKNK